jgi:hypothetical protein
MGRALRSLLEDDSLRRAAAYASWSQQLGLLHELLIATNHFAHCE